jgi:hypothetical protein
LDNPKIIIELINGQVTFNGPLGNKVLCYGLLELAKDIVRATPVQQSNIIKPNLGVPN